MFLHGRVLRIRTWLTPITGSDDTGLGRLDTSVACAYAHVDVL